MATRGNQLRAVLIPAGVALVAIGVLAWYGMYWIPSKQRYLDERNVRLLRTISAQIKVKVNNFDQAIDNAIESFESDSALLNSKDFQAYVKLFTPDLEIIDVADSPHQLEFDDPPRVRVVLDEGKHYLYLGYSHGVEKSGGQRGKDSVIAKADIEAAVGTYLSSHPEFDAIALLDHNGRAIAQQSATGVEIARLDTTRALATKPERRDSAGGIENVRIGGADYRFYVQPVQLSLLREKTPGEDPEEWSLCGLVRADHFQAASAEISSTVWLLFLATLTALLLAIPILKLRVVHPRERYHRADGVATAASSFLLAGLLTFVLLDAVYFGYQSNRESNARLSKLADTLNARFDKEVHAASDELDVQVDALDSALERAPIPDSGRRYIRLFKPDSLDCKSELICRTDVLLHPSALGPGRYPYYRIITWSDSTGWQRYKWTTSRSVTPFIDVSALPYVDEAKRAHRLSYADSTVPQRGLSVIRSPNTAEALTVIWRALARRQANANRSGLRLASLVTTPISMTQPVLPWGAQFAVVNLTGQVLYHSDSTRSMNENFFQEAMDNGAVRAAVVGRRKEALSAEYFGRPYRMYVQPVDVSRDGSLADPHWSLIVFEQALIPETVNLESLTLAVLLFVAYSLLLAVGWGVAHSVWPSGIDKWFWPDAGLKIAYQGITAVNGSLGLAFVLVVSRRSPPVLLGVTVAMSLIAIVAAFSIVTYQHKYNERQRELEKQRQRELENKQRQPESRNSERQSESPTPAAKRESRVGFQWFLMARVSLLFIVGVVPAMATFEIAEGYENGLLARRRSMHKTSELAARTERIVRQQRSLRLCPERAPCGEATVFLQQRLKDWDYELPVQPSDTARVQISPATLGLASVLAFGNVGFNNVAVDLRAAMPGDPTGSIRPYLEYLVLGALLALLIVFVVRVLVWPLYALDLYRPPGFATSVGHKPSRNILLIGPAGSGKTDFLFRRAPGTRVFDVGKLAFVEAGNGSSPLGRSASQTAPVEPAPAGGPAWADSLNAYTIPENGVLAIDHLDYRVDDAEFRDRMLPVLEHLVLTRRYNVWIASSKYPDEFLNVSPPPANPDRWRRLFDEFDIQTVNQAGVLRDPDFPESSRITAALDDFLRMHNAAPDAVSESEKVLRYESAGWPRLNHLAAALTPALTTESPPSREQVLFEFGVVAESYYRALFAGCSMDEKLALHQLAEMGVVNPRNHAVIARLMRKELVRRDPTFRIMNETFRRFVAREMSHESAAEWEREGVRLPWGSISTMMLTVALLPLGLMLLTQQELLGTWASMLPALTPMVPHVMKLISATPFGKRGAVPA